ncbi:MAG: hypothetical protein G01um101420_900 [Parcubacteria group bacterium Gr01-1014_20]|nr:MAG: hypothetical protein G01um101420_900 [Parcubacteria group bacterium Gr01-1014_20]
MFKDFLEKIQGADEGRKRKWLLISTTILVIGVGYLWLGYFNNLIGKFSGTQVQTAESVGGFSFVETMKAGLATIYDVVKSVFDRPKDYLIKP